MIQKTCHHLMIHRSLLCLAVFETPTLQFLHLTWTPFFSHAEQVQQYGLEEGNGQWLLKFTWSHAICFSEPQGLLRGPHGCSKLPALSMKSHIRTQEVSVSNFDPICTDGRRLAKKTMPKNSKNSFSCPLPCPALHPTTAYFCTPQVNITPTFCGFTRHPCSSEILLNFFMNHAYLSVCWCLLHLSRPILLTSSLILQRLSPHFSQLFHGNMPGDIHFLWGLTVHNNRFSSARIQKKSCGERKLSIYIYSSCPSPATFLVKCLDIHMRRCPTNSCMYTVIL
jgi:hypothetical protein